jgi:hypothetical protein
MLGHQLAARGRRRWFQAAYQRNGSQIRFSHSVLLPWRSSGNRQPRCFMPNSSIKNEKMYEDLRKEGNSKEKAARISNAAAARGTKSGR